LQFLLQKRTFKQDLSASPYSCLLTTKLNIKHNNISQFHPGTFGRMILAKSPGNFF